MKYEKWTVRGGDKGVSRALLDAGVPPLCAAVLSARGLDTPEQMTQFLACGEERLHSPFLLRDMDAAAARIGLALERGEKLAVYGDYDVDGITATALLTEFLRDKGAQVRPYIPDRMGEGYGLNRSAVSQLAGEGIKLIVTVDCGITAVEEVELARELGMDVVVTDHHQCKEEIPAAAAVVDPRRPDCPYPFKDLAGVGVALKLVLAMTPEERRPGVLRHYAELAAVGTVADVMSLTGENRALVHMGLALLENTPRPGLAALLRAVGAQGKAITTSTVSYGLAPRLNAAGRMERSEVALELLLTRDSVRGEVLADELYRLNRHRQSIELDIYEQCVAMLDRDPALASPCVVLAGEGWHQGVVGIVASRLSEKYSCPAFMICLDHGHGKGSCRSFGGFNLFAALEQCATLLEGYGGHALAAGFTIREENVPAFRARMAELVRMRTGGGAMTAELTADAELDDARLLSFPQVDALSALEPCGADNPRPVFVLRGVTVASCADVGEGRHMKLRLRRDGAYMDGIFFSVNTAGAGLTAGDRVDVAFNPQINEFRGTRSVQLLVCDLRPALTRAQEERVLFEKLRGGGVLTRREAAKLLPERSDFVAVWRFLNRAAPLEDTPSRLLKTLSGVLPPRRPHVRTAVCLEVFGERGLVKLLRTPGRLRVEINPTQGKVDLEQSAVMIRLRQILEEN